MSEFCAKCVEKEAQMEIVMSNFQKEIETLKARIEKLESENEALVMDVAFYGGNMINLSCNDK
jgi:predicted AlkP superfamily phosphohydrolase/phosphomutase